MKGDRKNTKYKHINKGIIGSFSIIDWVDNDQTKEHASEHLHQWKVKKKNKKQKQKQDKNTNW